MKKEKDITRRAVRGTMKRASHCRYASYLLPPFSFLMTFLFFFLTSCSNEKNTAQSRWWHSFNARYNTYFNGAQAYIDASLEKENGNKDNYTEMIPLYTVGNKNSRELGKSNFDRAIEKSQKAIKRHSIKHRPEWTKNRKKTERDIEWLNRKEYNPFLWKAWLLMGRSQFHKGAFDEAASTFAYMSRLYQTQPAIYGKARAWLAKCYIEQDWIYDAEDVITKMKRDSIDWRAVKEWDYTYADYYIHTGRYEEAIPYLRKVIRHEMRRKQKAREWYLMGQLEAALGHQEKAYQAFKHVIRQSPPYELEFNARIAMTEVMAGSHEKKMISRLKRMAASDKNKEYLDQVYYAIGNIYLSKRDTVNAIAAYEKGNEKATRSGIEKGVLLLHLGDLYWQQEKFSDAQRCYGEAIGLLDKDRDDYEQLSERSKILDELVPHTEAIHLQDSLQLLAKMSEDDRNAAIDRVIEALKKKEKEERRKQAEAETAQRQSEMYDSDDIIPNDAPSQRTPQQQSGNTWYFYNPMAVTQGKATFQRQWGKRENVDNWQRVNKTVVADAMGAEGFTDAERDSLAMEAAIQDSLAMVNDSAQNDPHKREYYLAQIPFTEEQVAESNMIIKEGLYQSGVIFKDKLDNLPLSEKQLRRLADQYPDFEHMDDIYYHLWLLYQRKYQPQIADGYLELLKEQYPESQWTTMLSDPLFEENARFGTHIEDSLYAATYAAFKADRLQEVHVNTSLSASRFPLGAHRDKFIFIGGLGKLNNGDSKGCLDDMQEVVTKYPESDVSAMAGMIINGVKSGRRLHGGKFDMGDVWTRRTEVLQDSDSIATKVFTAERNDKFVFIMAYMPDSVKENQLLYEMARFNFTSFVVRNFDIEIEDIDGLHRMKISGFLSYDEVLQYARALYRNESVTRLLEHVRTILISEPNLELLGTHYSYNDYAAFYEEHFIPLKISTVQLLTEPADIQFEEKEEKKSDDQNELLNGGVINDDTLIDLGIEPGEPDIMEIPDEPTKPTEKPIDNPVMEIPDEPTKPTSSPVDNPVIEIPDEPTRPTVNPIDNPVIEIPDEPSRPTVNPIDNPIIEIPDEPTRPTVNPIDNPIIEIPDEPTKPTVNPIDNPIIEIPNETEKKETKPSPQPVTGKKSPSVSKTQPAQKSQSSQKPQSTSTSPKSQEAPKKKLPELEDEYYELEGF